MRHFAVLTLLWSLPLFAQQYRPEVLPVKLEMTDRGHWQLSYHLPCDSIEMGIFLSPPQAGQVKIGMAVQRFHQRCASIGPVKTMPLPLELSSLLIDRTFNLVSFNPALEAHIYRVIHPLELKTSAARGLQLLYQTRCGPMMGLVVSPRAHATEVAILESEDSSRKNCLPDSLQLSSMEGLNLATELIPMPVATLTDNAPASPGYQLRMQPIQPGSMSLVPDKNGLVAFNYRRQCNQAPIGLVTRQREDKTIVAMLVAEYPQEICTQGSRKEMWTRFETRILQPKHLSNIRPARVPETVELELIHTRHVQVDAKQVHIDGFGDHCPTRPSTVHVEREDQILLGVLNAKLPGTSCRNQIGELKLRQARNPMLVWSDDLGPLRLAH